MFIKGKMFIRLTRGFLPSRNRFQCYPWHCFDFELKSRDPGIGHKRNNSV